MPVDHTEKGFVQAIEDHLLHHGYRKGAPANFDASLALEPKMLIEFLSITQKDEWKKLSKGAQNPLLKEAGLTNTKAAHPSGGPVAGGRLVRLACP